MAFNSYGFLLAFLPLTVALYWGVARLIPGRGRLFVLILASLFFYILAARAALLLLTVSMLFNFLVSRLILGAGPRLARMWLFGGVAGNIALLLYFKYMGFFLANVGLSEHWRIYPNDDNLQQLKSMVNEDNLHFHYS